MVTATDFGRSPLSVIGPARSRAAPAAASAAAATAAPAYRHRADRSAERQLVPGRRCGVQRGQRLLDVLPAERQPGQCHPASLLREGRRPRDREDVHVLARNRLTLNLGAEVGAGAFSAVFQSLTTGADIQVERSMYFGPNLEVSTSERASHVLSTLWMFRGGLARWRALRQFLPLLQPPPVDGDRQRVFTGRTAAPCRRSFTIPSGAG